MNKTGLVILVLALVVAGGAYAAYEHSASSTAMMQDTQTASGMTPEDTGMMREATTSDAMMATTTTKAMVSDKMMPEASTSGVMMTH